MLQRRPKYDQKWFDCLDYVQKHTTEEEFVRWFKTIEPLEYDGSSLRLKVLNKSHKDCIESKYIEMLRPIIGALYGSETRIFYAVPKYNGGATVHTNSTATVHPSALTVSSVNTTVDLSNSTMGKPSHFTAQTSTTSVKNPFVIPGVRRLMIDPNLSEKYQFSNFIEGDCNKLSRSAGIAVAASPGNNPFNPLYIYSSSGLGKTHLAHAIGNQIVKSSPQLQVLYVPMNKFQAQYQMAVKNGEVPDFINFYQGIDVLIIDDIQELTGNKTGTQNAFFNIFNHLHLNGKQIVLTSDKSPVELKDINERLLTRFKWGFASTLERPDYETRYRIIESKSKLSGVEFPADVIDYLATNIMSNIREIEGSISAIVANSKLAGRKVTIGLARDVIKSYVSLNHKELTVEQIMDVVSSHFAISKAEINSKKRPQPLVQARQIAMYLAKQYTNLSLSMIGSMIGGRNHSTVLHAYKSVVDQMETDKQYKKVVDELIKQILL